MATVLGCIVHFSLCLYQRESVMGWFFVPRWFSCGVW